MGVLQCEETCLHALRFVSALGGGGLARLDLAVPHPVDVANAALFVSVESVPHLRRAEIRSPFAWEQKPCHFHVHQFQPLPPSWLFLAYNTKLDSRRLGAIAKQVRSVLPTLWAVFYSTGMHHLVAFGEV